VLELAGKGLAAAVRDNAPLAKGVNIWRGRIVHPAVAEALGEPATELQTLLERS
jgi:alanine dehydrogenase